MNYFYVFFISGLISIYDDSTKATTLGPYLYGTSINTKGVANGNGIGAS